MTNAKAAAFYYTSENSANNDSELDFIIGKELSLIGSNNKMHKDLQPGTKVICLSDKRNISFGFIKQKVNNTAAWKKFGGEVWSNVYSVVWMPSSMSYEEAQKTARDLRPSSKNIHPRFTKTEHKEAIFDKAVFS